MIKNSISLLISLLLASTLSAQDDMFFERGGNLGGYGELHYNYVKPENGETTKTLDFHRFVLFYGYNWTEKWSLKAEVEIEHNFVADDHGELELEQAYINYKHADWLNIQVGVILPSVGLLNEFHEPPLFLSVERPDYHKNIIPTTWFGNGLAITGNYKSFDYKLTIMEGLNGNKFSESSGIRSGRQKGFKSNAENLLYNARVDYYGVSGLKAGISFTYNKAFHEISEIPFSLVEFHSTYYKNNVYAVFEYGNISYSNYEIEKSYGFYADLGYNVGGLLGLNGELIPFLRYSDYNPSAVTKSGGDAEIKYHNSKWMIGAAFKPIPEVVFKIDYSSQKTELGDAKVDYFNIGAGYMF